MAETVGLVLAVLPVLISAVEHYEDCWRPLLRYSKFTLKFEHFQRRFKVQKTIFRNECRLLLESVLEDSIASRMLGDSAHRNWKSEAIEERIVRGLESSKEGCVEIITQVQEQLEVIDEICRGFEEATQSHLTEGQSTVGAKAWQRVAKKLKFSFTESQLENVLAKLKALNDDFHRLSDQTYRLEGYRNRISQTSSSDLCQGVEKFRRVQEASRHAYGALSSSCTKHTEHLSHFCLEAVILDDASTSQVRFRLAFTHVLLSGSATPGDPIWFLIKSVVDNAEDSNDSPDQLSTGALQLAEMLKRESEISMDHCSEKLKKSVRFQSVLSSCPVPSVCIGPRSPDVQNLCARKNFCDQLRNFMKSPHTDKCLGMLDIVNNHKHLVYFPPSTSHHIHQQATSLKQVLRSLSRKGSLRPLPQYERLHLALSLATAVLQYHTTPWLQGSWRSDDIYFFGIEEKTSAQESPSLSAPYLNVPIKGPNSSSTHASIFPPFVRNPILFGLGVVLLEIGYAKTLRDLQQPRDRQDGGQDYFTEYFTATRLASSISRELGSKYREIVTKCLFCDFGCGNDLNEAKLQNVFYRDVVKELETLEDGFRKLQLEP